jgi:hypothetical protein
MIIIMGRKGGRGQTGRFPLLLRGMAVASPQPIQSTAFNLSLDK